MRLLFDSDDDAAVGDEVEGTVVVDFADEMDGVALSVCGNTKGCDRLVRLVNRYFRSANLRLLPPKEGEGVTIWIKGFRSVETNGEDIAFFDTRRNGDGNRIIGHGY